MNSGLRCSHDLALILGDVPSWYFGYFFIFRPVKMETTLCLLKCCASHMHIYIVRSSPVCAYTTREKAHTNDSVLSTIDPCTLVHLGTGSVASWVIFKPGVCWVDALWSDQNSSAEIIQHYYGSSGPHCNHEIYLIHFYGRFTQWMLFSLRSFGQFSVLIGTDNIRVAVGVNRRHDAVT